MADPRHRHSGYEPTDPPPPRRKVMGVEIREKADDAAPRSISPSGLLGWAARHGRNWNPIGVALMFALMVASLVLAVEYTDAGKMLVKAWKANTAEVAGLRADLKRLEAKADRALAGNEAIREELRVQGQGNATKRIVALEDNMGIVGIALVELNGAPLNDSFPRARKGDFGRPAGAPEPVYPLFTTAQQWATKPE